MYSIMKNLGLNVTIRCSSKKCPVKYPEVCPINFPFPCPNHPDAASMNYEKEHEKENDKILGRWKPHTDFKKTAMKVDYANVDHCGPCGDDDVRKITSVSRNNL